MHLSSDAKGWYGAPKAISRKYLSEKPYFVSWQKCRVVFLARAEKEDYSNPKKFAESSLFLLKCLERLISDKALISYQLNENLYAYRRGVYFLVFKMKDTVLRDKYAMGIFVNTEGPLNYVPF